ncbi:MFS transporter [Lentibacillus jeotgali]|uniref:MFS transporter n=1 Tax=Lentibacillus jeotgali TaxID=558169 RepID=UPI0002628F82|nr:MFS transporter [Lentibacillus jeotgali]
MLSRSSEIANKVFPEQKLFLIWSCAVFFVTMNSTMFNVSLPSVQEDLSISISHASWIISGYSMVLAISTLTFSRLSEFVPTLKLLILGVMLLGTGSFLGFFSYHFIFVLITRLIQAIGAGSIISLSIVVATRYVPITRRGRALVLISSSAVLGLGLGPVIGGVIDQFLGWNFLFLVTALVIFFIPIFVKLLPKEEHVTVKFDSVGCMTTTISLISLMIFFTTFHVIFLFLFLVFIILTSKHFYRTKNPFIKSELLKSKQYRNLLYINFIAYFVYFSGLFILPYILNDIFQLKSSEIGLLVFPGAILSALAAKMIGQLIDRFGNSPIIWISQVLFIISTLMFIFLATISPIFILFSYLFLSPGFSALSTSVRNEVSRILHVDEVGTGMGIIQLIQFFGGSFGVTISGTVLAIQEGFSPVFMYRNVYIILIVLFCTSVWVFFLYQRKLKICIREQ